MNVNDESTPRDPLPRAIANVRRLCELFRERRRQLARAGGLTEAQWQLLEEIAGEGFMPSLFAKRRACTPAAVSRHLRELLDRGLVTAAISSDDGRQRIYRLTAAGRRVLRRIEARRAEAIDSVWHRFGREELASFAEFTSELNRLLEERAAGERG